MAAYKEAYAPFGILETELVVEIAKGKWRCKRASSVEDSIFAQGHLDHAADLESGHRAVDSCLAEGKVWKQHSHSLMLISLYETRLRCAVEKDIAALEAMQANARKPTSVHKTKPSVSRHWQHRTESRLNDANLTRKPVQL